MLDFAKRILPEKFRPLAAKIKQGLFGFGHLYYSQHGEDIIIASLFRGKRNGFYVDVGAHHPLRYSNTYCLHKQGWRGINIDPSPEAIRAFRRKRPRDINLQFGVAKTAGERLFHIFSDPALNTFSAEDAARWSGKSWVRLVKKISVPVLPLGRILDEHLPAQSRFDLLNVDAEGIDLEVLESNDWERYRPLAVIVESSGFDPARPGEDAIFAFLTARGYRLRAFAGPSLIFTRSGE